MAYAKLLEDDIEEMQEDLISIDKPKIRLKLLTDIDKSVVPALSSVSVGISEDARGFLENRFKGLTAGEGKEEGSQ